MVGDILPCHPGKTNGINGITNLTDYRCENYQYYYETAHLLY